MCLKVGGDCPASNGDVRFHRQTLLKFVCHTQLDNPPLRLIFHYHILSTFFIDKISYSLIFSPDLTYRLFSISLDTLGMYYYNAYFVHNQKLLTESCCLTA